MIGMIQSLLDLFVSFWHFCIGVIFIPFFFSRRAAFSGFFCTHAYYDDLFAFFLSFDFAFGRRLTHMYSRVPTPGRLHFSSLLFLFDIIGITVKRESSRSQ